MTVGKENTAYRSKAIQTFFLQGFLIIISLDFTVAYFYYKFKRLLAKFFFAD
jgi:hypothetical protein